MTKFLFLLVIVGFFEISIAQVPNNNIQNRLTLDLNADYIFSSTAKSNVEWGCINKVLTNKCLVYHNDQWFNFSVPTAGTYFINILDQKCRDARGLQLIVIEGNPCETKSYRILHCIPKIRQDDVFVQLDSLNPKVQYLINIDGFLGDFCEFGIQVSEKPSGLPRTFLTLDTVKAEASRKGRLVNLNWTISEDKIDQFQSFKIYRTFENGVKSDAINEQTVSRNSYGVYVLNYSATDSLPKEGTYVYRIFGIQEQTQFPFLLVTRQVKYTELKAKLPPQRSVTLELDFKDKTSFKVLVYDDITHTVLKKFAAQIMESKDRFLEIDLGQFIDNGLRQFMILVPASDASEAMEFYYFVDEDGGLIKQ